MERRVLLAIFLAFLVLYTWQAVFVKPVPKPAPGATATASASATGTTSGAAATASVAVSTAQPGPGADPKAAAPLAAALVAETAERDVRVETRDVVAVFTNRGARDRKSVV